MAAEGELLTGLPHPEELKSSKGRAEVFGTLRAWIRRTNTAGDLDEAGRIIGQGWRCSVLCFLRSEAGGGVRRNQARELLSALEGAGEWAAEATWEAEELDATATSAAMPPAAFGVEFKTRRREVIEGLPSKSEFEDPSGKDQDVFKSLNKWVKARRSQLSEAGALLDADYRRSIFSFLCSFSRRKTVFQSWSRETLWLLAGTDSWCAQDVVDHVALADALADYKDVARRGSVDSTIASSQETLPAPRRQSKESKASRGDAEEPKKGEKEGKQPPDAADRPKKQPAVASASSPPNGEGRPVPEKLRGLPHRGVLEDAEADGRDIFRSLRNWVRTMKHAGELATVAAIIEANHRRSIFDFLCGFASKKTVFRDQAVTLLKELAGVPEWRQGDVLPEATLHEALQAAQAKKEEPSKAQEESKAGTSDHPSEAPGLPAAAAALQGGGGAGGLSGVESLLEVRLPSTIELEDSKVAANEVKDLFRRLCTWIFVHQQLDCLSEEAAKLTADHRRTILRFLCSFASKRSVFKDLARKVLGLLRSTDAWCENCPRELLQEVSMLRAS